MVVARRAFLALLVGVAAVAAQGQERFITVASTTSTEQSGLFGYILPIFEAKSGTKVRVVALGTGQALELARRGDADVAFVHAKAAEEKFLAESHGVRRYPVMYNDFVLIGPVADPAKVKGNNIAEALKKVAVTNAGFISRGDKSGTHAAELRFCAKSVQMFDAVLAHGVCRPDVFSSSCLSRSQCTCPTIPPKTKIREE